MGRWFEWQEAPMGDFAVLGDPVSHSLSPLMQQAALRALGRNESYIALRVPKPEIEVALKHLIQRGYQGVNCTVPLKETALANSQPTSAAARVGAVNTLRLPSLESENTDLPGFLMTLRQIGIQPGWRVLVLGAGGSARAIHVALGQIRRFEVFGANRTPARLETLRLETQTSFQFAEFGDLGGFDLIIDCTSANAQHQELALDWKSLKPGAKFYSLMYGSTELTMASIPILRQAESAGCKVFDGRLLLAAQGVLSLGFWGLLPSPSETAIALHAMQGAIGIERVGT